MHHDASRDAPPTSFIKATCKGQAWGAAKALFCRNIMETCEAKEHGNDSKQKHQVEGPIMQAKEWTREFGRCNPMEHAVTKQQSKDECAGEKLSREERGGPRPSGVGWPAYPLFKHPGAPLRQVSLPSSSLFVCSSL
jgi:hypothetical protein